MTRPQDQNGLGLTIEQAAKELKQVKRFWVLIPEVPLLQEWERVVQAHRIAGKSTHDARIVAAMHLHGIDNILTFDASDFARYTDIIVIDPAALP